MPNLLSKLLGKGSAADIEAALAKAQTDQGAAEDAVAAADKAYDDALLNETPAALRKLADARTDANIELDRTRAVIAKLEAELEKARVAEAEATRRDRYDKARQLSEAARKKMARDYPKAAHTIRDLLKEIAEADMAVAAANEDLPEGAARLVGPEAERSTGNAYREDLGEEVVDLWAPVGSQGTPIPDEMQRHVQDVRMRRGVADSGEEAPFGQVQTEGGGWLDVVKRRFVRRKFLPQQSGRVVPPLSTQIVLPPLHAGASPFWEADNRNPTAVLAELAKPLRPRPEEPQREPEVEYSLAPRETVDE